MAALVGVSGKPRAVAEEALVQFAEAPPLDEGLADERELAAVA
jgi:hypothetical protein